MHSVVKNMGWSGYKLEAIVCMHGCSDHIAY